MKQLLLVILCVVSLSGLLASELFVLGESENAIGNEFIAALKSNAPRDGILAANDGGFIVLDVDDQGYLELREGRTLMLTVVIGAGEDADEWWDEYSISSLRNYYHLKTVVVLLDEANRSSSIQAAVSQTFGALQDFFVRLQNTQLQRSNEIFLQSELMSYAASVIQFYKTPINQGGSGYRVEADFRRRLAEHLGWNRNSFSGTDYKNNLYKIEYVSSELVTLSATPQGRGYDNGPLYFIDISFPNGELSSRRNPAYGE